MEHLELYILGFLGVVIHLLKKLWEARKKKIELDHILETISTIISLLIVGTLVYVREDLAKIFPIVPLTAIILGYSAQSVFRFIVNLKTKDITIKPQQ